MKSGGSKAIGLNGLRGGRELTHTVQGASETAKMSEAFLGDLRAKRANPA
jgi:hypothetical protein